jgi:hypothetical protein
VVDADSWMAACRRMGGPSYRCSPGALCALCVCSLFVLPRAEREAGGGGAERGDETRAAREKTRERECDCERSWIPVSEMLLQS